MMQDQRPSRLQPQDGIEAEAPRRNDGSMLSGVGLDADPRTAKCRRLLSGFILIAVLSVVLISAGESTAAGEPVTVPVRILPTPAPPPEAEMIPGMSERQEPEPATPGARLPQYQLHHLDRGQLTSDAGDSRIRLILALPQRPLIIEARITVDGRPYPKIRDERVQEILRFASDPEKFKSQLARWENAKAAAAGLLDSIKDTVTNALTPENSEPEPAPDDSEDEAELPEAEPENEEVAAVPEYVNPRSMYERIERYMAATGVPPTSDEIHWLLTNWVDGPVVLFLNDNFQRFRADQKPVFKVLDRDRDGIVSARELEMATASFEECDLNRNDIVEATELAEVVSDPREKSLHAGQSLLISRIPTAATAALVYRRLASCYSRQDGSVPVLPRLDDDKDGRFSPEELERLSTSEADMTFSIAFNTRLRSKSAMTLDRCGSEFAEAAADVQLHPHSMTMTIDGSEVDFLAVQEEKSDQISIGAVDDGYPMLPVIDPNDDGRFTIRELRELDRLLRTFDRNHDGALTSDETRSTIRVCFGLGPTVHRQLALLRSVNDAADIPEVKAPEWFYRMDRNGDNDISPNEFPGEDEVFAKHDADGDGLISAAEANRIKE